MKISFGPILPRPSWEWVGAEVARAIVGHEVSLFRTRPAECDVAVFVKELPVRGPWKSVYCPVDFFGDEAHVASCAEALGGTSAVIVHCERLTPFLQPFCRRVEFAEHHVRHGIPPSERRPSGGALWVGFAENFRPTAEWLSSSPRPWDLTILAERRLAPAETPAPGSLGSLVESRWSVRRQTELFMMSAFAVDVKGSDFRQATKPPTKAQQFVASGVPFAANRDSYSFEYFLSRGFRLAEPGDADRLGSDSYARETAEFGENLRERLSVRRVADSLLRVIQSLE